MKIVLLVAALPLELNWVKPRKDVRWIKAVGGPGQRLAGAAADKAGPEADTVISAGLCGALDPSLQVGDIVIGTSVNGVQADASIGVEKMRTVTGPILSIDRVAGAEDKRSLRRSGAVAVEMEAAAVHERARRWGKPFYCIKSVSDTMDEAFTIDFNSARGDGGEFQVSRIIGQALRRPFTGIPELLKLKRNSQYAAKALGDFLADCRF